jgi:hypothetical protein
LSPSTSPTSSSPRSAAEAHRERLDRFAEPKPLEQRDLLLCAGGYRYEGVSAPVAELAYEDFKRAADRT